MVTPTFRELFDTRELQPTPVFQAIHEEGPRIVIGAFAPLASFAMFHMVTVFPLSWVFLFTEGRPALSAHRDRRGPGGDRGDHGLGLAGGPI